MTRSFEGESPSDASRGERRAAPGKLKVCHIAATNEGARWMVEQLRDLRDQYGWDVTAIVSGERGGLIEMLRRENIPYHVEPFAFDSLRDTLRAPGAIVRLARFFRRERFDVVQTHLFISMILGRIAAWLADVPVRLAMIDAPFCLEAHTSRWIDRSTCWMETALIPSCEYSQVLYRSLGVSEDRLALIYYGPDERKFDPQDIAPADVRTQLSLPPDSPLICQVAYFYPRLAKSSWVPPAAHGRGHKGYEDLVKAAPLVLAEFPEAKFLLVGSGWGKGGEQYLEEVKELVRSLGLNESILFLGYREDAKRILREADVAVQASLSENLGGTIEALLMECPTVATRVGGMVDSVRDGETGRLVSPADPEDLARGIIQMLRDRETAHALGRAGRKLMLERFTLSRTVKDLNELYHRLLAKERRRFYNPLISLWRLIVVCPVLAYVAFRLFFIDLYRASILYPVRALLGSPFRLLRAIRFRMRAASKRRRSVS